MDYFVGLFWLLLMQQWWAVMERVGVLVLTSSGTCFWHSYIKLGCPALCWLGCINLKIYVNFFLYCILPRKRNECWILSQDLLNFVDVAIWTCNALSLIMMINHWRFLLMLNDTCVPRMNPSCHVIVNFVWVRCCLQTICHIVCTFSNIVFDIWK